MNRSLLSVTPALACAHALLTGNKPIAAGEAAYAASYLGTFGDTALHAIDSALTSSGLRSLVAGLLAERDAALAELLDARRDLAAARAALCEANDAAGEILARGPLGTLEAAAGADTLS